MGRAAEVGAIEARGVGLGVDYGGDETACALLRLPLAAPARGGGR